ncbi:MAG: YraN family protein [Prevotella sp.]|nr:YraN family protein [Prevotella sp.]
MATHNELGKWGEEIATAYLRDKGFVIVERNWHSQHRDLDIVALDASEMVFVEVKTRRSDMFAYPDQTIPPQKRKHLQLSINHYVKSHHITRRFRVDIITVIGDIGQTPQINHLADVNIW